MRTKNKKKGDFVAKGEREESPTPSLLTMFIRGSKRSLAMPSERKRTVSRHAEGGAHGWSGPHPPVVSRRHHHVPLLAEPVDLASSPFKLEKKKKRKIRPPAARKKGRGLDDLHLLSH